MQTNYVSIRAGCGAVALPVPRELARQGRQEQKALPAGQGTTLAGARREVAVARVWETAAWLALAAGSLAVLVISLWV